MGENLEQVISAIREAAKENLKTRDPEIKKQYISEETWQWVKHKNDLINSQGITKEVQQLSKYVKKLAYRDKKVWLQEQFNEHPEDKNKKQLWKCVKNSKSNFNPKYIKNDRYRR